MTEGSDRLALADWRRTVAQLYAEIRHAPAEVAESGWQRFRQTRDRLFKEHEQSPLNAAQRRTFRALAYHPYDRQARLVGTLTAVGSARTRSMTLPDEGQFRYTKVAWVDFDWQGNEARLALYWIEGYGGGLFLPFGDASNGQSTYGGGRYLYDTIKGADLGAGKEQIRLDFNFAYNPSCAYNDRWVCPLPPQENRLDFAIRAGEKAFEP